MPAKKGKKKAHIAKKAALSKEKIAAQIKKMIPENIMPKNLSGEDVSHFFQSAYDKGSRIFSKGAKEVGRASGKFAHQTRRYYNFNQLKLKIHLTHAKIGEYVEEELKGGKSQVYLNEQQLKALLATLSDCRAQQAHIKDELAKK